MRYLLIILLPLSLFSQQQVTIYKQNAVVQTPEGYAISGKKYPCVVFFQGIGETGTDWSKMYVNGIGYYMKLGKLKKEAIYIAIQQNPEWASVQQIENTLQEIYNKYPVDSFSLTGLSAGSLAIIQYMGGKVSKTPIRAIVPMSYGTASYSTYNTTAYNGVKVWGFCGTGDKLYYNFKATIEKIKSGGYSVKTTYYNGGHSGWNTYYNPDWKENGQSIYDFMIPPVFVASPVVISPPAPTSKTYIAGDTLKLKIVEIKDSVLILKTIN